MATFVKGDVVVVPFPFSDLSNAKRRPALVVAAMAKNDLLLCMITSQSTDEAYATPIYDRDFITGSLNRESYSRGQDY